MIEAFVWRDAGRTVVFRHEALAHAPALIRDQGFDTFELVTTARALASAEDLGAAAAAVHRVPAGPVPEIAAAVLDGVGPANLVALGGGRAIDTAKAVASVTGAAVAAIPTTLSGAEMTGIHRLPAGAESRARSMVRPQLVLADPAAMTGLPEQSLRASAMNALAHGADSLYTPLSNPVSRMTALRGGELIATALDEDRDERNRDGLALGALLCGYAIDSGGFALHHVVCQTLVRVCGTPHAETNAAILPGAMAFMAPRAPEQIASLAKALGAQPGTAGTLGVEPSAAGTLGAQPGSIARRIATLAGEPAGLGALGADRSCLGSAVEEMLRRPELGFTPGAPDRAELVELIEGAW